MIAGQLSDDFMDYVELQGKLPEVTESVYQAINAIMAASSVSAGTHIELDRHLLYSMLFEFELALNTRFVQLMPDLPAKVQVTAVEFDCRGVLSLMFLLSFRCPLDPTRHVAYISPKFNAITVH